MEMHTFARLTFIVVCICLFIYLFVQSLVYYLFIYLNYLYIFLFILTSSFFIIIISFHIIGYFIIYLIVKMFNFGCVSYLVGNTIYLFHLISFQEDSSLLGPLVSDKLVSMYL